LAFYLSAFAFLLDVLSVGFLSVDNSSCSQWITQ